MCVTPGSGRTVCGRPAASSVADSRRVGGEDVVVGQAVDEHERAAQVRRVGLVLQRRAQLVKVDGPLPGRSTTSTAKPWSANHCAIL